MGRGVIMDKKQLNKAEKLAEDVLTYSRNTLLVNLRFLDMALSQFEMIPCEEYFLMTDGKYILYNAKKVLFDFKRKREISPHAYLHMVMHCVYRHMFMSPTLDRPLWNLACDIAVENVISELGLKSCDSGMQEQQEKYISDFKNKANGITAEKIYNYLKNEGFDKKESAEIRECFYVDNHEIWYMSEEEKSDAYGTCSNSDVEEKSESESFVKAELANEWQKISERMQINLETFGKQQGDIPGDLMQNLKEVNREKYDYTSFLKKFATLGEMMKINDDEFDYIFYTYGLKMYEKMPLIEPLEYKEVKRIKEFVIAIDTSGSTSNELVQKFIQKTYNILKSTESFFEKTNLHIIQCDEELQEDVKITTQEDFDYYIKTMQIHGLGGTDFKPVFTYVDELIKNKEFVNLKGLIYFTDGNGKFPVRKPDYETAFVYVDDDFNNYDVPAWAIKLILKPDEI